MRPAATIECAPVKVSQSVGQFSQANIRQMSEMGLEKRYLLIFRFFTGLITPT